MSSSHSSESSLAEGAKAAFQRGEFEAAIEGFKSAREKYLQSEDHLMAAEMGNNLSVALLQASQFEGALQAVEGTPQLFLEAEDKHRAAMAFGNLASALEATGDLQAAEQPLQRAIQLFQETGDKENLMHTAKALSQLQLKLGKPLEAVSSMQGGLTGQSKLSLKNRVLRSILSIPSRILGR